MCVEGWEARRLGLQTLSPGGLITFLQQVGSRNAGEAPSVSVRGSDHAPSVGRSREGLTFTQHLRVGRGFPHLTLTTDDKVSILTFISQKRKQRLRKAQPLAWGCTQGPGKCGSLAPVSPLSPFSGSYGASQAPFSRNLTAQRQKGSVGVT